jgi:predicted lipoprotein with Yx(FWY)xxD motif
MKSTRTLAAVVAVLAVAGAIVAVTAAGGSQAKVTLRSESALGGSVLAAPNGHTLYRLSPETARHLLCTSSACLGVWKPLTVKTKSTTVKRPSGAKGSTGFVKRGKAFQVTLGGKPLYTFSGDSASGQARGDGIRSFGGTWHAMTMAKAAASTPAPAPAPSSPGGYGGY